jgi:hypothetical protein
MELVVHIGTYKTGSTYLQQFINRQYAAFERLGIYIPEMGRDVNKRAPFHNLAQELIQSPVYRAQHGTMADLRADLLARRPEKALISSEVLSTAVLGNNYGETSRAAFHELAEAVGARLHYVVFVRDQPEVINSTFCQGTKQLTIAKSFERWFPEAMDFDRFNYLDWLAPLLDDDAVKLSVFDYEAAQSAGLMATFLSVFDAGENAAEEFVDLDRRANSRPGPATIAVGQALAFMVRSDPSFAWHQPRYKRLSRKLALHSNRLGLNDEGFWGWTEAGAVGCGVGFRDQNDLLAQRVWNRPWTTNTATRTRNTMTLDEGLDLFDNRAKADLFNMISRATLKNED